MKPFQSSAYASLALLYCLAMLWVPFTGDAVIKALPIVYLAVLAWQNGVLGLTGALAISAVGDVLLAFDLFELGLAAFLVAQLCYAALFARQFEWRADRLAPALMLLLWCAALLLLIVPVLGNLKLPVFAYLLAIVCMGLSALFNRQSLWPGVAGAACFIVSDSLIALEMFTVALPAHGWAIMVTYYLAQWLLTQALIQSGRATQSSRMAFN
ncbi:lysoplasmalogenase [Saccharospirillum sp. MSK14-1]|uniref:lysoplasmalogenase n=1 Tax=Saccharospirillum sp. MSK14-1 TaxID=1897632 RepID=UPI001304B70C|nr:lysoplasmalogenase [Saccharospirillum sp. MSK14-1]